MCSGQEAKMRPRHPHGVTRRIIQLQIGQGALTFVLLNLKHVPPK